MTDEPTRTPYCHKIRYGITGTPTLTEDEMDGSHAPGIGVAPTLIELVYSAARDGKPASMSASVTGDWTRFGERADGQVAVHFKNGPDGWPAWLAEEARVHDPDAAPGLSPAAGRATVPAAFVVWLDASDGSVPTHDGVRWPDGRATLHHRHFGYTTTHADPEAARQAAHGKQGRLVWPAPADRAAVYGEVAEMVRCMAPEHPTNASWVQDCHHIADRIDEARPELRRMADETQQPEAEAHWSRTGGFDQHDDYRTGQPAAVQQPREARP